MTALKASSTSVNVEEYVIWFWRPRIFDELILDIVQECCLLEGIVSDQ